MHGRTGELLATTGMNPIFKSVEFFLDRGSQLSPQYGIIYVLLQSVCILIALHEQKSAATMNEVPHFPLSNHDLHIFYQPLFRQKTN